LQEKTAFQNLKTFLILFFKNPFVFNATPSGIIIDLIIFIVNQNQLFLLFLPSYFFCDFILLLFFHFSFFFETKKTAARKKSNVDRDKTAKVKKVKEVK
jgi:hypothetical protein